MRRCGGGPAPAPGASWTLTTARALAIVLVVNEITIRIVILAWDDWDWATDLPLQLSDAALVVSAIALWLPRPPPKAYELTFFWAFTATLQAVLTPDLGHGPDHYFFWAFFIAHSGVLVAVAYLTWGRRMTLSPGAVKRALLVSVAWTALAAAGCLATGGNDMFLREPPPDGSLLDLFGPWPWYVVAAGVIAVLAFLLAAGLRRCDPVAWWRGYGELSTSGRPGVVLGVGALRLREHDVQLRDRLLRDEPLVDPGAR